MNKGKRRGGKKSEWVLRGSLYRLRRKCGRKNCHCADGEPHESWALSLNVGGRTQMVTLHEENIPAVKAALARHQQTSRELEARVQRTLKALRAQQQKERQLKKQARIVQKRR